MVLKGKKVVVVGGSSGIGLATAEMAKHEALMSSSPRAA
jgi:NAD(P)-dependent dehydrogenase (short-subunit alcohol dehydrogenase family)